MGDANGEEKGILVAIRMRPLNDREKRDGQGKIWRCLPAYQSITQTAPDGSALPDNKGSTFFTYDTVFDESSSTDQVYTGVAKDLATSVVKGMNGTIFAYGQTSSGKTFTMQGAGAGEVPGIVHMAASDIFESIRLTPGRDFLLRVSYLEIYNEEMRDLLNPDTPKLHIREDPRKGVYVDAHEEIVTSFDKILDALRYGEKQRHVDSTEMNARSSRSHTIFRIVVESKQHYDASIHESEADVDDAVLVATLNLVDLAGSESVRHTGATGQKQKEGGKINQSLLALSRVIQALSQAGSNAHVSFRDSKLTRILQPSLCGNASMAIICCATPADGYLEETRSTLQFAQRAKMIKTHAVVNEILDDRAMIKRLKKELAQLKDQQQSKPSQEPSGVDENELKQQLDRVQAEKAEQEAKINRLTDLIINNGPTSSRNSEGMSIHMEIGLEGADCADAGGKPLERKMSSRRNKRARETWCPGEFGVPLSPSMKGRGLQALVEGAEEDDNLLATLAAGRGIKRKSDAGQASRSMFASPEAKRKAFDSTATSTTPSLTMRSPAGRKAAAEVAELKEQLEASELVRSELEARVAQYTELEEEVASLREQMQTKEGSSSASTDELAKQLAEALASKEEVEEELKEFASYTDEVDAQKAELEANLAAKEAELEELKQMEASFTDEELVEGLMKEKESLEAANKNLKTALEEAMNKEYDGEGQDGGIAALKEALQAKAEELAQAMEALEMKERELATTAAQLEAALQGQAQPSESDVLDMQVKAEAQPQDEEENPFGALAISEDEDEDTDVNGAADQEEQANNVEEAVVQEGDSMESEAADQGAIPAEVAELAAALEASKAEAEDLMQQMMVMEEELKAAREGTAEAEAATAEKEEKVAELSEALAASVVGAAAGEASVVGELAMMKSEVERMTVEMEAMRAAAADEAEAMRAESEEAAQVRIAELATALEASKAEIEGMSTSAEATGAEIESLKAALEASTAEMESMKSATNEADGMASAELEQVSTELEAAKAELMQMGEELTAAKEEAEHTKASTAEASEGMAAELEQAMTELEAANAAVEEMKAASEAAKAEMEEMNAAALEQAMTELETANAELEEMKSASEAAKAEMEEMKAMAEMTKTELETAAETEASLTSMLEASRSELETVQHELTSTKAAMEEPQAEAENLREQLSAAKEELQSVKTASEASETEVESLMTDLEAATNELEALKASSDEAQAEVVRLQLQLDDTQEVAAEAQKALEESQAASAASEARVTELTTSLEGMNANMDVAIGMEVELKAALENSKAESEELTAALEASNVKASELEQKLEATEAELQEAMEGLVSAEATTTTSEEKVVELMEALTAAEARAAEVAAGAEAESDAAAELQSMKAQLEEMTSAAAASEEGMEGLQMQLETSAAEAEAVRKELDEAETREKKLQEELAIAEAMQEELSKALEDSEALGKEVMELTDQLVERDATVSSLETETETLKQQLREAEANATPTTTESAAENHDSSMEVLRLKTMLDQKNSEQDQYMQQIDALTAELKEMKAMFNAVESASVDASADGGALKKKMAQLQCQLDLVSSEKDTLEARHSSEVKEQQDLLSQSASEVHALTQEVQQLKESLTRAEGISSANASAHDAIAALEAKAAALKSEKEDAEAAAERARQQSIELEGEIAVLKTKLDGLGDASVMEQMKEQLAAMEGERSDWEAKLSAIQSDMSQETSRCKRLQADVEMLRTEYETVSDEAMSLRNQMARIEEVGQANTDNNIAQFSEAMARMTVVEGELATAREALESNNALLQQAQEALVATEEEAASSEKRAAAAEAALDEVNATVEEKVEAVKAASSNEVQSLTDELEQVRRMATEMEGERVMLIEKNELLEADATKAEAAISELQSSSQAMEEQLRHRLETQVAEVASLQEQLSVMEQKLAEADGEKGTANLLSEMEVLMEGKLAAEAKASDMEQELQNLRVDMRNAERRAAEEQKMLVSAAQDQMATYEEKLAQATGKTQEQAERVQKLEKVKMTDRMVEEFEELRARSAEKDERIAHLEKVKMTMQFQKKFQKLKEDNVTMKEDIKDLKARLQQAESYTSESSNSSSDMAMQIEKLEEAKDVLSEKLRKYAAHCQKLEAQLSQSLNVSQANAAIGEVQDENASLRDKLREGIAKFRAMEENDAEMRKKLEDAQSAMEAMQQELETKAGAPEQDPELASQNRFLEEENLQLMLELKEMKKSIAQHKSDLEAAKAANNSSTTPTSSFCTSPGKDGLNTSLAGLNTSRSSFGRGAASKSFTAAAGVTQDKENSNPSAAMGRRSRARAAMDTPVGGGDENGGDCKQS